MIAFSFHPSKNSARHLHSEQHVYTVKSRSYFGFVGVAKMWSRWMCRHTVPLTKSAWAEEEQWVLVRGCPGALDGLGLSTSYRDFRVIWIRTEIPWRWTPEKVLSLLWICLLPLINLRRMVVHTEELIYIAPLKKHHSVDFTNEVYSSGVIFTTIWSKEKRKTQTMSSSLFFAWAFNNLL